MSLSQDFFDYSRMDVNLKQRLGYKGAKVITPQVGQPGDIGYIPADITVGLIDPVIIYPEILDGMDLPGRTGGTAANFDNSLSIAGSHIPPGISAPMVAIVTAPTHVISTPVVTTVDYNNLRNSDQGETGVVTVELVIPPTNVSLIENLANLQTIDAVFEYWDGAAFVVVASERRWDLANVLSYEVTLPVTPTGQLQLRTTFGPDAVEGDYRFVFTLTIDDVKRFTAYDDFEVTV